MGDDDMKVEQTSTSTDDAPMESSEDAPMAGENEYDQTAGETGSISDTAATGDGDGDGDVDGDEDRSTAPDENEMENENDEEDNESKSVSTTTNNAPDENDNDDDEEESKSEVGSTAPDEEEETKSVGTSATPTNENENDTPATPTTTNQAALASPESTSAPPAAVEAVPPPKKKRGKPQIPASARKGRAPAVKGLNIPFRTVKKVSSHFSTMVSTYIYIYCDFVILFSHMAFSNELHCQFRSPMHASLSSKGDEAGPRYSNRTKRGCHHDDTGGRAISKTACQSKPKDMQEPGEEHNSVSPMQCSAAISTKYSIQQMRFIPVQLSRWILLQKLKNR